MEKKVQQMEEQRQEELKTLQEEKEQLRTLILRQTAIIGELEQQLLKVSSNNSVLHHQQQELLETVNDLIYTLSTGSAQGRSNIRCVNMCYCYCSLYRLVKKEAICASGVLSANHCRKAPQRLSWSQVDLLVLLGAVCMLVYVTKNMHVKY